MKNKIIALAAGTLIAGAGLTGTAVASPVEVNTSSSSGQQLQESSNAAEPARSVTGRNTSPSKSLLFFTKKDGYGTAYFVGPGRSVNGVQSVFAPYRCATIVNGIPRWEGTFANSAWHTIALNATSFNCG